MSSHTKAINPPVPPIKITLTTFVDNENGELSQYTTDNVKIDGEENGLTDLILDCSIFKSALIKNLLVLSFGQFLLFMAFDSLSNVQSTMNSQEGLGSVSLTVAYGGLTISSFFLPTAVVKTWGCKKTIVLASICFLPYILANFYPTWSTLSPTAFVCGLASGLLWTARSVYINRVSHRYAKIQRIPVAIMNAWFFSVCTTFRQNTEIWGSLLSYYTLKLSHDNESHLLPRSVSRNCGSDFCGGDDMFSSDHHFSLPSEDRRYILITIFTALVLIAAFFMTFFLDPLESEESSDEKQQVSSADFLVVMHQLAKSDQILLLPLSFYTGLVDGFYSGDFEKAYITCAWGIPYVGAVSICYGVVSTLVDTACGPCVQILGRAALFLLAAIAHLTMLMAFLLWRPDAEHTAGFFLIASAHGIGNGVWMSQLVALYGILFKDNEVAGFSCYYFLNSIGHLLAYSYSSYLCTSVKVYIPLTMLVIGVFSYLALEVRIIKKSFVELNLRRQQKELD